MAKSRAQPSRRVSLFPCRFSRNIRRNSMPPDRNTRRKETANGARDRFTPPSSAARLLPSGCRTSWLCILSHLGSWKFLGVHRIHFGQSNPSKPSFAHADDLNHRPPEPSPDLAADAPVAPPHTPPHPSPP